MVSVLDLGTGASSPTFTLDQTGGADYLHQGLSISRNGHYVAVSLRSPAVLGAAVAQVVVIDRNDPQLSDDGRHMVFAIPGDGSG